MYVQVLIIPLPFSEIIAPFSPHQRNLQSCIAPKNAEAMMLPTHFTNSLFSDFLFCYGLRFAVATYLRPLLGHAAQALESGW